jgi:hypothetical protein
MEVYFCSFYPLTCTRNGRIAAFMNSLPYFIDGSRRREPDFQHPNPCITGLYRSGFVKKLKKGDIVIYTSNKFGFGESRLVAIMKVIARKPNHRRAAEWYDCKRLQFPNSLMVSQTRPFPFDQTHQLVDWIKCDKASEEEWDNGYKERIRNFPEVAICQVWRKFLELYDPPVLSDKEMKRIFGRVPVSRIPTRLQNNEWKKFQQYLNTITK